MVRSIDCFPDPRRECTPGTHDGTSLSRSGPMCLHIWSKWSGAICLLAATCYAKKREGWCDTERRLYYTFNFKWQNVTIVNMKKSFISSRFYPGSYNDIEEYSQNEGMHNRAAFIFESQHNTHKKQRTLYSLISDLLFVLQYFILLW